VRSILIDSDVILDLFVALEPHHTVALHFFSRMELARGAIVATTSPVTLLASRCSHNRHVHGANHDT